MNKQDVVCVHTHTHTHNGVLLSHKKEWNNAICSNMNGPRDNHTKWSKLERGRYIYDAIYMWNLKKWYKWTYIEKRNRLTDRKKLMVSKEVEGRGIY